MRQIDLGRLFLASFKAGQYTPKIEGVERIVVIDEDMEYFAYRSDSEAMDQQICEAYLNEMERSSGTAGEREIISAKEASDRGLNKKGHYGFDTELEYELYCVISIDC